MPLSFPFFGPPSPPSDELFKLSPEWETKLATIVAAELGDSIDLATNLSYSPYAAAERLTGKIYRDDPDTEQLGRLLAMVHSKRLQILLQGYLDTSLQGPYGDYLEALLAEGFYRQLQLPYADKYGEELFELWWHPDGILLNFDTWSGFGTPQIGTAEFYYNWIPTQQFPGDVSSFRFTQSGTLIGPDTAPVWAGRHDARTALRLHLRELRAHGTFLPVWLQPPDLYLLHGADDPSAFAAINQARINLLSPSIRAATHGTTQPREH